MVGHEARKGAGCESNRIVLGKAYGGDKVGDTGIAGSIVSKPVLKQLDSSG
jgi:hypothetical protein